MKHFKFLRSYWRIFALLAATGSAVSFLEIFGISLVIPVVASIQGGTALNVPYPLNIIADVFGGLPPIRCLQIAAVLIILIVIVKGTLLLINEVYSAKLKAIVVKHFRIRCFGLLMKVGIKYFNSNKAADFYTLCTVHTSNLGALAGLSASAVPKMIQIFFLMIMMLVMSWKVTLFAAALVVFSSLILQKINVLAEKYGSDFLSADYSVNRKMLDGILGMKIIRLFNRENDICHDLGKEIDGYNAAMLNLSRTKGSVQPLFESIGIISAGLIILLSTLFLFGPDGSGAGVLVAFLIVFGRVASPVMDMNHYRVIIKGEMPYYRQVFDFLNREDKCCSENSAGREFNTLKDGIRFNNVTFGYTGRAVLRNASFEIKKGSNTGIAGRSGSGKSTVSELIMRFYDPQEGNISVDGIDLKEYDINGWRKNIGVVTQDVFLFNDTVRNNIAFGKPEASMGEVESAAKRAYAHDFIMDLPDKYDTLVGDRGVLLSGGQRQRLAIARAILPEPEILIFDEATSSLDTDAEKIVQKALNEVSKGRTVITIAHRLSTIADSDNIIVIENGAIAEAGSHRELMRGEGLYKKLVEVQSVIAK